MRKERDKVDFNKKKDKENSDPKKGEKARKIDEYEEDVPRLIKEMRSRRKKMEGKAKSGQVLLKRKNEEESDEEDTCVKRKSQDAALLNSRLDRVGNNSSDQEPQVLTPTPLVTPRGHGPPLHYGNCGHQGTSMSLLFHCQRRWPDCGKISKIWWGWSVYLDKML